MQQLKLVQVSTRVGFATDYSSSHKNNLCQRNNALYIQPVKHGGIAIMAATQGVWHYFYLDLKSSYVATLHKPCMEDVKMVALKLELRSAMPWRAEDLFPRHDSAPYVFMDRRPLSLLYIFVTEPSLYCSHHLRWWVWQPLQIELYCLSVLQKLAHCFHSLPSTLLGNASWKLALKAEIWDHIIAKI